jgi:hypothetical protein
MPSFIVFMRSMFAPGHQAEAPLSDKFLLVKIYEYFQLCS